MTILGNGHWRLSIRARAGHSMAGAPKRNHGKNNQSRALGVRQALMSQLMTNLVTLSIETVLTEVTWDDFGLLDFLRKTGFTPTQRLVLAKRVD